MHRVRRVLLGLPVLSVVFAQTAFAQIDNRFAIGAEYTIRMSDRASQQDYAHGDLGPGLLWRFGTPKTGWGFHWGLNWYAVNIDRPIGGVATELGELHIRPFMAGWGYTRVFGRTAVTGAVLGGYAFGSIGLDASAVDAYERRLGARAPTAESSNTMVLKPEIGVWYDVNRRFGVNVNAGYMLARPDVTITSSLGIERRQARADQFILKAGLVYSIF